jgi:hypothetical protein
MARNPEEKRAADRAYRAANPERPAARWAVLRAVRAGQLERGPCEQAGPDCHGRVEGHHDDYTRPLAVRWLCRRHHVRHHAETRTGPYAPDAQARRVATTALVTGGRTARIGLTRGLSPHGLDP